MTVEQSGAEFTPAYGEAAEALLERIQPYVASAVTGFTNAFYASLDRSGPLAEIIARLRPDEFDAMKAREAEYVMAMLSPSSSMLEHRTQALRCGRIHALVGVDIHWLVESSAHYQQHLAQLVIDAMPLSADREATLRVVDLRILFDLREQSMGYRSVSRDVATVQSTIDRAIASTANLSDLVHAVLEALGTLPGEVSGFFARADEHGIVQIEASFGHADRYHEAMEAGVIPKISIDAALPQGQGPTGRSWRTGAVTVSDAWLLEPDRAPWRSMGESLGFRAAASVPLIDETGHTIASIALYSSYPGFFSTNRVNKLLGHLRDVLSHACAARLGAPVIPLTERLHYRHLLEHNRVAVHYQPIVDLRTGALDRVEALARLVDKAGTIVPPHEFLYALGDSELFALFSRVLRQACVDWRAFTEQGLLTRIAINIPAQALGDMRYLDALFSQLSEHGLPAKNIVLEVLETQGDASDAARHEGFIAQLRQSGMEIEQDDLGSGHSSLVRMDRYPFDAVKIDQELVRGSLRNPQRALEFVLYLTRLAHALQTPVTVEGLENTGIIEAAAILGADRGQGYGISRPMPAHEVAAWARDYRYPVDPQTPHTALGAMAAYLMWDLQLAEITRWPNLVQEFAEANSIVEHFVAANRLEGSSLDDLLRRSRVVAREGAQSKTYQQMRAQIIHSLRSYWLDQENG